VLPGRGTTFVRELAGPRPGAPCLLLLHGWTASADLNWFRCYDALGAHYRVVALDHRGHGGGIRSRRRFRLTDCADDAVALADVLGIERFVAVGYSMGGPIAQLVWQRHRERVAGLVLCATAAEFSATREEQQVFRKLAALAAVARITPAQARRWLIHRLYLRHKVEWEPWAIQQAARHEWVTVLEAGRAIGDFDATSWIGSVDVPASLVITERDDVVPPRRQEELLAAVPGATAYRIDGGHDACVGEAELFVPALLAAARSVCDRAHIDAA
jgi:3-oxoadipate enol-lactonase